MNEGDGMGLEVLGVEFGIHGLDLGLGLNVRAEGFGF